MKLKELVPESTWLQAREQRLNDITGFWSEMALNKGDGGEMYRAPSMGANAGMVNVWLRSQYNYRQQLVTDILTMAMTIEEIRSPISRIVSEVFRRGIDWKPKFAVKCIVCNTEYEELVEECETCKKKGQQSQLREPDEQQKERFDQFLDDCNIWDQSLIEVLKVFLFDVNALDDGFLHIVKEYSVLDDNSPVRSRVIEIRRLHPATVEIDLDNQERPKNAHFFCLIHRDESVSTVQEPCPICNRNKVPAMYKYMYRGEPLFLLDSEVIHHSKFAPDELYGFSPILTIFEKALVLRGMDSFLYRYFFERKVPASMVMVFTDSPEELRKQSEYIAARTRGDPNYVPLVAVSSKNNRGRVDLVRLFNTLQEMEYLPVRQEIRERIAAIWGVTPAWQGSPEAFGGLSTQTTQLTVMSRVVEDDQNIFHNKVFPTLLDSFGVTDWFLELQQPEEKAEATRITFAQQRVSVANMLLQMGFKVEIKSKEVGMDDIEFVVSGEAQNPQQMFGGGGAGGPEGGLGGLGGFGGGGEEENQEAPMQFMQKAQSWMSQISDQGYPLVEIQSISKSGDAIMFKSIQDGQSYIAKFLGGKLVDLEKTLRLPRLHQHGQHPPHDVNMPHNTMARKSPAESALFEPDEPDVESV